MNLPAAQSKINIFQSLHAAKVFTDIPEFQKILVMHFERLRV